MGLEKTLKIHEKVSSYIKVVRNYYENQITCKRTLKIGTHDRNRWSYISFLSCSRASRQILSVKGQTVTIVSFVDLLVAI